MFFSFWLCRLIESLLRKTRILQLLEVCIINRDIKLSLAFLTANSSLQWLWLETYWMQINHLPWDTWHHRYLFINNHQIKVRYCMLVFIHNLLLQNNIFLYQSWSKSVEICSLSTGKDSELLSQTQEQTLKHKSSLVFLRRVQLISTVIIR